MDRGGWVDSAALRRSLAAVGCLSGEVADWLVSAHTRFPDTFGSPEVVLLVVPARLDREGACLLYTSPSPRD
eukprot:5930263-Alexandrium_andersonii.AAC.1